VDETAAYAGPQWGHLLIALIIDDKLTSELGFFAAFILDWRGIVVELNVLVYQLRNEVADVLLGGFRQRLAVNCLLVHATVEAYQPSVLEIYTEEFRDLVVVDVTGGVKRRRRLAS